MIKVQIMMPEELKEELIQAGEAEGLDLSNYIRWALRRWLRQQNADAADTAPARD